jgi:tetratricopeptide (TPR) repeat protein
MMVWVICLSLLAADFHATMPSRGQSMDVSRSDGLPPIEARRCLVEAQVLVDEGRLGGAAQKCERALELWPNWAEAQYLHGVVLERMGFVAKAKKAYERASHPDAVSCNLWAGQEPLARRADNQAETGEAATRADPGPDAHQLLEEAHDARDRGKLGSALRKCEAALRLAPDFAEANDLRGVLLDDMGHTEEAVAPCQEVVRPAVSLSNAKVDLIKAGTRLTGGDRFSEIVAVRTFAFPSQAHIAQARLQIEGIPCFVAQDDIVSMNWLFLYMVRWVKLCVWQEDAERALAILDWTWPDESESGLRCPRCGSANVRYEKYNLRLVYAALLLLRIPIPFKKERWSCWRCGATWKAERV